MRFVSFVVQRPFFAAKPVHVAERTVLFLKTIPLISIGSNSFPMVYPPVIKINMAAKAKESQVQ
jgi:hypothetical protein